MHDLRFAVRIFAKSPGFAAVAVVLIALATGLNTAPFSLLHATVLEPLPYRESERLVAIGEIESNRGFFPLSPANFADVSADAKSIEGMTAYLGRELELGVDPPQRVNVVHVSDNFFSFLGVPPLFGRALGDGIFHRAEPGRRLEVRFGTGWRSVQIVRRS